MHRYDDYDHWGGAHVLGWLLLLVGLAGLALLIVWAVRRITAMPAFSGPAPGVPGSVPPPLPPSPPPSDTALEAARLRYARGEIDRDTFLRIAADLGRPVGDPGPPTSPGG